MDKEIQKAIEVLKQGGIVIFPTDTAFGIGCRIDDEKAIARLFAIRNRPENQPTPVLFDSIKRVKQYILPISTDVEGLMNKYWPGALTIILACKSGIVPGLVRGGGRTLGVRIPDHPTIWQLVKGVDAPILGPSANFHGQSTPYSLEALDKKLIKLADYTIEGKTKGFGSTSTVIDCSVKPWKIIRQGVVKVEI